MLVCAAKSRMSGKKDQVNIRMNQYVKDGTRCSYNDPHGICTGSRCVQYGCDYSKDTRMKYDNCGRCNGNNEHCIHVKKLGIDITRKIMTSYKPSRMHKVVQLMTGSRNIKITYQNWRGTRLNLRSKDDNNPHNTVQFLRPNLKRKRFNTVHESKVYYKVAVNTLWTYTATRKTIEVTATGPISGQVNAYIRPKIRSKNRSKKSGRSLGYSSRTISSSSGETASRNTRKRTFNYEWWYDPQQKPKLDIKNFMWYKHHGTCSVTCGNGYENPILYCINRRTKTKLPYKFCTSLPKPHRVPRPCSTQRVCETPPKWVTSGFSPCSKSCGFNGIRTRRVYCQVRTPEDYLQKVHDQECIDRATTKRPSEREQCNYKRCEWRTGSWGTCSKSCGTGTRQRLVKCLYTNCQTKAPPSVEDCNYGDCKDETDNQPSDPCTVDGSFFCHGNTDYCYVKGYRDLCCKTCANYNPATRSFDKN